MGRLEQCEGMRTPFYAPSTSCLAVAIGRSDLFLPSASFPCNNTALVPKDVSFPAYGTRLCVPSSNRQSLFAAIEAVSTILILDIEPEAVLEGD